MAIAPKTAATTPVLESTEVHKSYGGIVAL